MRVAILSPNPADQSGGVERFCHTLRRVVVDLGGEAEVIGVEDVAKVPADVLVTNGMLSRRTAVPRVHVYHGCWVDHVRLGSRTSTYSLPWKTKFLLSGAGRELRAGWGAYRVAVSERTAAEVRRWYGYRAHRVIPNGVDTATFQQGDRSAARAQLGLSDDERLALFIGRPEPRKRPDLALAAATRAGYRLLTAGSRSIAGATALGLLAPDELGTWIQAVDCVLAPSEYEGCSLAILEAIAAGSAVITTRVGYVPTVIEAVPAYADLTAPPGDVGGFVAALHRLPTSGGTVADVTAFVRRENDLTTFARHWEAAFADALRRSGRPVASQRTSGQHPA